MDETLYQIKKKQAIASMGGAADRASLTRFADDMDRAAGANQGQGVFAIIVGIPLIPVLVGVLIIATGIGMVAGASRDKKLTQSFRKHLANDPEV